MEAGLLMQELYVVLHSSAETFFNILNAFNSRFWSSAIIL